jgi:hypothetical protein
MYNYLKSLAHQLRDLTKEELLQDVETATTALKHARYAAEQDRHAKVLEDVMGELNWRFAGWQQPATAEEVPYEKELATCSICHKYKGCWSDSEACSDCDEAEDERKMAYNETLEPLVVARHTAPAAPHGKRDLGYLLLLAFALCGLLHLSGCAGPARLPERPVVQHAAHDNRTKTAEPLPSRIR